MMLRSRWGEKVIKIPLMRWLPAKLFSLSFDWHKSCCRGWLGNGAAGETAPLAVKWMETSLGRAASRGVNWCHPERWYVLARKLSLTNHCIISGIWRLVNYYELISFTQIKMMGENLQSEVVSLAKTKTLVPKTVWCLVPNCSGGERI